MEEEDRKEQEEEEEGVVCKWVLRDIHESPPSANDSSSMMNPIQELLFSNAPTRNTWIIIIICKAPLFSSSASE